jgi:hypothetical protein
MLLNRTINKLFYIPMKKQILRFALVAAMIGSIAAGCSSEKSASGSSDSTTMDSTKMSAPAKTDTTMRTDTMRKDTTKTPPKM